MPKGRSLRDRYNRSYDDRDKGVTGVSAFDWRKLDEEPKFYKPKEGKNRINIVPYRIKTKNHPLVRSGEFQVGDPDYIMDVWIHRNVGPSEAAVICPKLNFNKSCPLCDMAKELKSNGEKEEYDSLKARRRALYNVIDLEKPEAGIQVFDVSHALFEKELIEEAREAGNGDIINFADVDEGSVISFRGSTEKLGKREYLEFKSFHFRKREEDEVLKESIIDKAISFDELMKVYTSEEIERLLHGAGDDDEDGEKPSRTSSKDEEPEEVHQEREEKPASRRDKDDEDDEPPSRKKEETRKPSKDEEDDEPPSRKKEETRKPSKDEEEEAPRPSKEKAAASEAGECPKGHKYGKDCDNFADCDSCSKWDACAKAGKK